MKTLEHCGYLGTAEVSIEDGCLFGRLLHIRDVITYEGQSLSELEVAFTCAVDEYLQHCKAIGKLPNRPYGGTFNVRIGSDRHRLLDEQASRLGKNLNEIVCAAVDIYFSSLKAPPAVSVERSEKISFGSSSSTNITLAAGQGVESVHVH